MQSPGKPIERPARVLMYTAYLTPEYSGAALQALTLARELRLRGHHVEFITNRWPGLGETAVVDGFPVQRLEPGRLRKHREFRLWFNMARYVWARRRDFDILHSHGAYFANAFIGPLARLLGLRSLVKASLARDDLLGLSRPLVGRLHRFMLRRSDVCVGISKDLVEEFLAGGVSPGKIHPVPNGVDTARFRRADAERVPVLRANLGLPVGRPIVLYVGVLDARKNILWLAEQWVAHDAFGTGALLVAVGPQSRDDPQGVLHASLAELARAHPQQFVLHDFNADVVPYYQCVDLLVLPSYKEGMPNVVLEAMACSLPCVAARASGSRELIVEGETGFTYAPDDSAGLGAAVQRCLSPAAAGMRDKTRRHAVERYSIRVIADQYEALYRQLLPGGRAGDLPLLMITELFLPTKGGTAVMFEDDCRRLGGRSVHIVTAAVRGDAEVDVGHPNTVHRLPLERSPWVKPESLFMYLRLLAKSLRLSFANRFVAALAGRALPEGLVAWAVGRLRGCKVVIYAHGEELTGWGRGWKFKTMCFALRRADKVLANSDFTLDTLISLIGVRREQIVIAYPTVDADRFHPGLPFEDLRASIGLAPAQRLVLSVGRLQRRKGFDNVVRSLPGLVARGIDVHYAIAGIGDDWDYLTEIASKLGVSDRLHLLGHVEPADLPRWYSACDLFAMPNRDIEGDTEGFGIVYLEANACAKPAIAGCTGGTGSAVEDGLNGLRVDGDKVEAVEAGIARLLLDAQESKRLGEAGRQRILDGFTPQRRVALIRRVITS
ncbi:MAG TPA: glycosyltransferase family 4 protein [Burkholderiaceae bacterium]|nr:glycosyltransferase family 4 protein [Burkholderiaceae bacterium]